MSSLIQAVVLIVLIVSLAVTFKMGSATDKVYYESSTSQTAQGIRDACAAACPRADGRSDTVRVTS